MIRKRFITLLAVVALVFNGAVSSWAQVSATQQKPQGNAALQTAKTDKQKVQKAEYEPFLTDESRPNGQNFLSPPPEMLSGEFYNDYYYYKWGIKMREDNSARESAIYDNSAPLREVFSKPFGFVLSKENTPEILKLMERAVRDVSAANTKAKNHFKRIRPFVHFNHESLVPENDAYVKPSYSYPSGHSCRGYMCALVLSAVAPQASDALMNRARQYAFNRLICGHHWKSDIEASMMIASGVFAALVANPDFQKQLAKAQKEYQQLNRAN